MKKEKIPPQGAMRDPASLEALSRLKSEKEKEIEYYYFDRRTGKLSVIPPSVDKVDLDSRHKNEYIVKTQNGSVLEIKSFQDELINPERKTHLVERIEKSLEK